MSVAQTLAIAVAAWVTAMAAGPSTAVQMSRAQTHAAWLADGLESTTSRGFCATPDGIRLQRRSALR